MELYKLAANCDYKAMENEMIRDRLVVGIRDSSLSQTLQLDPQLTLEVAKKKIRQREAVQQQQQTLKGTGGTTEVEEVHARRSQRRHGGGSQAIRRNTTGKPTVHINSHKCVDDAARDHIQGTNVQPKKQPATAARKRATTAINAFQKQSLNFVNSP